MIFLDTGFRRYDIGDGFSTFYEFITFNYVRHRHQIRIPRQKYFIGHQAERGGYTLLRDVMKLKIPYL